MVRTEATVMSFTLEFGKIKDFHTHTHKLSFQGNSYTQGPNRNVTKLNLEMTSTKYQSGLSHLHHVTSSGPQAYE